MFSRLAQRVLRSLGSDGNGVNGMGIHIFSELMADKKDNYPELEAAGFKVKTKLARLFYYFKVFSINNIYHWFKNKKKLSENAKFPILTPMFDIASPIRAEIGHCDR